MEKKNKEEVAEGEDSEKNISSNENGTNSQWAVPSSPNSTTSIVIQPSNDPMDEPHIVAVVANSSSNTTSITPMTTTGPDETTVNANSAGRDMNSTQQHLRHHRWCTPSEITQGRWIRVWKDRPPYVPPDDFHKSSVCYNDTLLPYANSNAKINQPWPTYDWVPDAAAGPAAGTVDADDVNDPCYFQPFDASVFCQRFVNHTISIVGDSLSFEMYAALVYALGNTTILERDGLRSGQKREDIVVLVCPEQQNNNSDNKTITNKRTKLTFRRDDALEQVGSVLEQQKPHVLILNRGAHYAPDWKLKRGVFQVIEQVNDHLSRSFESPSPHLQVLWRLTVPGHPYCWRYDAPSDSLDEMWSLIQNISNYDFSPPKSRTFKWWELRKQNDLVVEWLRETPIQILDPVNPAVLRPDFHRHGGDCLHSCYPGRMDFYNQLFLHQMMMETEMDGQVGR